MNSENRPNVEDDSSNFSTLAHHISYLPLRMEKLNELQKMRANDILY